MTAQRGSRNHSNDEHTPHNNQNLKSPSRSARSLSLKMVGGQRALWPSPGDPPIVRNHRDFKILTSEDPRFTDSACPIHALPKSHDRV